MGNIGEAVESLLATKPLPNPQRERQPAPKGWEPGVAWDGKQGTLTTRPLDKRPDTWDDLLRVWDMDPEKYEVVEPVQYRAWDTNMGEGVTKRLFYYKATIRERRISPRADVDALITEIRRHKKPAYKPPVGDDAFVLLASDWQIGKEGTEATVKRILSKIDAAADRVRELRKTGRPLGSLYVLGLGDVVEQCFGHYAQQLFTTELNMREQRAVARRLIVKILQSLAPLFEKVVVAAVPGNHGENVRLDGKSSTDFGDSSDIEVFEGAAEVLAANPEAYGHVSFVLPNKALSMSLEVGGSIIAMAHAHQTSRGSTAQQKAENWWKDQSFGMRSAGEAMILFTGHFHHFSIVQNGPRTHIQAPTIDDGSQWFEETAGTPSVAGMVSLVLRDGGWDDLKIL